VLHTDTWDGASDQLKGVVESLRTAAEVVVDDYSLTQSYFPPPERIAYFESQNPVASIDPLLSVSATERSIQNRYSLSDLASIEPSLSISGTERLVKKNYQPLELASIYPSVTVTGAEAQKQFRYSETDIASIEPSVVITGSETIP